MPKHFNLYVPAALTYRDHFLPRIGRAGLETFEVDAHRFGIQRPDHNHLLVFLEHSLTMEPPEFLQGDRTGRFAMEGPTEALLFKGTLAGEKEVSVYSLFYTNRMTSMAWRVILAVADDPRVLVMDEARHFLPGPDCALELRGLMV